MNHILSLLEDAINYPVDDAPRNDGTALFDRYALRLARRKDRLFCSETSAAVSFWDLDQGASTFHRSLVTNLGGLKSVLGVAPWVEKVDPLCRFIFLRAAGHSRARLTITHQMFLLALAYSQAMPEFVDFLSFFGRQMKAENLYFSGFYQRTRVLEPDQGIQLPQRHWSGYDLSICYSLKSVECSVSHEAWPWSIRHCAIYHSFDLLHARSTWIVLKGDDLLEQRVKVATEHACNADISSFENLDRNFTRSLAVSLLIAEWSTERWSEYIESLEDRLQEYTEDIIPLDADSPIDITTRRNTLTWNIRDKTWKGKNCHRDGTAHHQHRSGPDIWHKGSLKADDSQSEAVQLPFVTEKDKYKSVFPSCNSSPSQQSKFSPPGNLDSWGQREFSFKDLQKTQDLEERAHEAAVILRLNLSVVSQLRKHYLSVADDYQILQTLKEACKQDIRVFARRLSNFEASFDLQILRLEALLQLLQGRKALLYGLLDFRKAQACQSLAWISQDSAQNMEDMTHDMRTLTRKTKTETVSMKIITLATLFFLPGTFISTFMSTGIVNWETSHSKMHWKALQIYLYISLPLTFAIVATWAVLQIKERRKEKCKEEQTDRRVFQSYA